MGHFLLERFFVLQPICRYIVILASGGSKACFRVLLSQSLRLASQLAGYSRFQLLCKSARQMRLLCGYSRFPRSMSYCVALTFRRLCSSQSTAPEKNKRRKKPETKVISIPESGDDPPVDGEEAPVKRKARKGTGEGRKSTIAELQAEHVAQEPESVRSLLRQYDAQLNRRKQQPDVFYVINDAIADEVVRHLAGGSLDTPHLELGPGPGVLTRRLLTAGVRNIACFEPSPVFQSCVKELADESDGAVRLVPLNLLHLGKFYAAATHGNETRVRQTLFGLTRRPWHEDPCLRVVGVAHRSMFFKFLVRTVIGREHIFQFGRPELLVFVPDTEYMRLSAVPGMGGHVYRPYSIISQMLFDIELLHRVPARHFYPWMTSRKKVAFPDSEMILIRYVPKVDPGVPESELHNLDFFVRHCAASKNRRIVQQLEEWVPGCGPRLIAMGHGVFSPFRELVPAELLRLFREFSSWPEYRACSFHSAVQQNVMGADSELAEADHLSGEDVHEGPDEFETEPYR